MSFELQDLLDFENNSEHINELLEVYEDESLLPYVGAGFSILPGDDRACPSWVQFLEKLFTVAERDMVIRQKKEFKKSIKDENYEYALDVLVKVLHGTFFYKRVESIFAKPRDSDPFATFPEFFINKFKLFHETFPGPWLTTNLDRFIEASFPYGAQRLTVINTYTNEGLKYKLERQNLNGYLFKLHGDAKEPQEMIFAQSQYEKAYGHKVDFNIELPLPAAFKYIFTNYSLLFIGCSLTIDRPLKILKSLAGDGYARPQFALLLAEDWLGESDTRKLRRQKLNSLGIKPIYLKEFADISKVFEFLLKASGRSKQSETFNNVINRPEVFVGREEQLNQLKEKLGRNKRASNKIYLIHGHGGIGKTTLAREVIYLCRRFFHNYVEIFVGSMTPISFAKALAQKLGFSGKSFENDDRARAYIADKLKNDNLLLLLDNVDSVEVLLEFLPKEFSACVIITSRDIHFKSTLKIKYGTEEVSAVELKKFTKDETLDLFKRLMDDEYKCKDENAYIEVAANVGYLPLVLRLVITTMLIGEKFSVTELLDRLRNNEHIDLTKIALSLAVNEQELGVLSVFNLYSPILTEELRYCLALLAVCETGELHEEFLCELNSQVMRSSKVSIKLNAEDFDKQLRILVRFKWCDRYDSGQSCHYSLHQIVRFAISEQLINSQFKHSDIEESFIDTVHKVFIENSTPFIKLDNWITQTDKAVLSLKNKKDVRILKWIAPDFFNYCKNRGLGDKFIRYCRWVREVFTESHIIAMSYGNEAIMLKEQEAHNEALKLHKKEQKIDEEANNKKGLSQSLCNQAIIMYEKGRLSAAYALVQKEIQIKKELGDDVGLSKALGNQALILFRQGHIEKALENLKEVMDVCLINGDDVGLARTYKNIAVIMNGDQKLPKALELLKSEEEIRVKLGDELGLAICLANQSNIMEQSTEVSQAIDLLEQAIAIRQKYGIPCEEWQIKLSQWKV